MEDIEKLIHILFAPIQVMSVVVVYNGYLMVPNASHRLWVQRLPREHRGFVLALNYTDTHRCI